MAKPKPKFLKKQPKAGEVVLHCGHLEGDYDKLRVHFSWSPKPMHVRRPDGSELTAQWILECNVCFKLRQHFGGVALMRADAIWTGDAPVISTPSEDEGGPS